jgi:predicted RNA methylase
VSGSKLLNCLACIASRSDAGGEFVSDAGSGSGILRLMRLFLSAHGFAP